MDKKHNNPCAACLPAQGLSSLFTGPLGIRQREIAGVGKFEIKNMQIRAVNAGGIAGDDAAGIVLPPAFEMLGGFYRYISQQIMP